MDRGVWQATVHCIAESDMTEATEHVCMHTVLIAYTSDITGKEVL